MGLLRPYDKRDDAPSSATTESAPTEATERDGASHPKGYTPPKGRPTRSRAQAEAERMERLHPTLSKKEQRKANRKARMAEQDRAWERRQMSPERQLMRDYVDSRYSVAEFVLPVMLVFMALSFAFARNAMVQQVVMIAMLTLLIAWVGNVWLYWRGYKREALQRYPQANFRGVLLEMNSRMMNIRKFRNPAPRVERGGEY